MVLHYISYYQEACQASGLLGDDKELIDAWTDSLFVATTSKMRQLFVTIIIFCDVTNSQRLFGTHWFNMCEDIIHKTCKELRAPHLNISELELNNNLLFELEKIFHMSSSSLKKFQLPMLDANQISVLDVLNYDSQVLKHQHANFVIQLNTCQRNVYEHVTTAIEEKKSVTFFVHGSGETRKIFLWHTIISKLRSEGKIILAVTSSGIASLP